MSQTALQNRLTATLAIASLCVAMPANASTLYSSSTTTTSIPTTADGINPQQVPQSEIFLHDSASLGRSAIDLLDFNLKEPGFSLNIPSENRQGNQHVLLKEGTLQSTGAGFLNRAIATIYAHDVDGRSAATVYVRNLPIFTFLGTTDPSTIPFSQSDIIIASDNGLNEADPVVRATIVSSQLNQRYIEGLDAGTITVRWNAPTEEIFVEVGTDLLLSVDETVILPDTTGDVVEDALQATNRLRRQLGETEELTEISGLPVQPVQVVRSTFSGMASWYGPGFHGRFSASGERFNQHAMTAAHRTLPFGTVVEVTNLNTGISTTVRINDRGPYGHGRVIDLSAAAARAIGMMGSGVAPVRVDVLE